MREKKRTVSASYNEQTGRKDHQNDCDENLQRETHSLRGWMSERIYFRLFFEQKHCRHSEIGDCTWKIRFVGFWSLQLSTTGNRESNDRSKKRSSG